METLARSSWKAIFVKYTDTCFSSSRDIVLSRPPICSVRFPELVQIGLSHSISLQHKRIYSISASSVSSSEPQVSLPQTHLQNEETQNEETQIQDQSKTVPVKFQLQKECSFGEQFYIIGDDPVFGSWDPARAVPLEWSDGHVWTVELDIPIGKSIHYKFILKGISGSISWQPDPNRILQTWESENKIAVSEDWDDAELQKIVEEGLTSIQNEESTINSEKLNKESTTSGITNPMGNTLAEKPMAIVAENITEPKENHQVNIEKLNKESTTSGITNPMGNTLAEKPMAVVAENITEPKKNHQVNIEKLNKESTTSGITNPMGNTLAEKPMAIVAENITEPKENHQVNIEKLNKESTTSGIKNPMGNTLAEKPMAIVAENITEPKEDHQVNIENILGNNGRAVTVEDIGSIKDEGNLVSFDGSPVLVPGLTTLPTGDIEEAMPTEAEKNIASDSSFRSDKAEEHNVPKEEFDKDSSRLQETTEMMHGDHEELNVNEQGKPRLAKEHDQPNSKQVVNDVMENDIQWGRRTLQKFLSNLGLL
ncbi:uncharacterized protein LOC132313282 isoform X2 [Cornus florida]|uniref:uncharacterized protein LOC132313282 isoform X2 n=1 Tax=Cornus florida TaxID=4283 RepID=UPI00289CB967|nr:uncharacterized protein LOC132313282 isoform X2 [Cornus florida]